MSGPTARSGPRASTGPRARTPSRRSWTGTCWLGPAPKRPFKDGVYHAFNWRGWFDFGTGALGDMACHTVNMPFRALKLGYPNVVECEAASQIYPETFPKTSRIRFEFPAREGLPPLKFWWYDGNPGDKVQAAAPRARSREGNPQLLHRRDDCPSSGALIIGEKGKIFSPDDYGDRFLRRA